MTPSPHARRRAWLSRCARVSIAALVAAAALVQGCGRPDDEAWLRLLGFKQGGSTVGVVKDSLRTATTVAVDVEFENGSLYVGQKSGTGILVTSARVEYRLTGFSPPGADHPLNLYLAPPADSKATSGTLTAFPLVTPALKAWLLATGAFGDPGVLELTARVVFTGVTDDGARLRTEGSVGIELTNTGASSGGSLPAVNVLTVANASKSGAPGSFTVFRSGSVTAPLTVGYTTIGSTAVAGIDYTSIGTSVTIPAGSDSASITVTAAIGGTSARVVKINLSPGAAYTLGSLSSASVTIVD